MEPRTVEEARLYLTEIKRRVKARIMRARREPGFEIQRELAVELFAFIEALDDWRELLRKRRATQKQDQRGTARRRSSGTTVSAIKESSERPDPPAPAVDRFLDDLHGAGLLGKRSGSAGPRKKR